MEKYELTRYKLIIQQYISGDDTHINEIVLTAERRHYRDGRKVYVFSDVKL